jgi:sterol 14-demethylase
VFNGAVNEISAADIYRGLTLPIFGKDVCYDCPPSKLMEQKKVSALTQSTDTKFLISHSS